MGDVELTVRLARHVLEDGMKLLWQLEDELTRRVKGARIGSVDGHGVGTAVVEIFVSGSDRAALKVVIGDAAAGAGLSATSWLVLDDDDVAELPEPQLPPVVICRVDIPPRWGDAGWYELRLAHRDDAMPALFHLDSTGRPGPEVTVRRLGAVASPIVSCTSPARWPNGTWEPWTVDVLDATFFSLHLPDWLLTAPDASSIGLRLARQRLVSLDAEERARRREDQALFDRPTTLIDTIADADAASGVITWWTDSKPANEVAFETPTDLLDILRHEADAVAPRQHLITLRAGDHSPVRYLTDLWA